MFLSVIVYSKSRIYLSYDKNELSGPVKIVLMAFQERKSDAIRQSMANQVAPLLTLPQLSIGYQILLNYGLLRWALFYKFTNLSC